MQSTLLTTKYELLAQLHEINMKYKNQLCFIKRIYFVWWTIVYPADSLFIKNSLSRRTVTRQAEDIAEN